MKLKLFMLSIVFLLSILIVNSANELDFWQFENNLSSSGVLGSHLTNTSIVFNSTNNFCGDFSAQIDGVGVGFNDTNTVNNAETSRCIMYWAYQTVDYAHSEYSNVITYGTIGVDMFSFYHLADDGQGGNVDDYRVFYDNPTNFNLYWQFPHAINQWRHHAFSYDNVSNNWCFYVNGTLVSCQDLGVNMILPASPNINIGADWSSINNFDGQLENVRYFETNCTNANITPSIAYNNGVCLEIGPPAPPAVEVILNTSLFLADFNVSSVQFATSSFFDAYEIAFNTTATVNLTFLSAFNTLKISGGATNQVFGRILIDSAIVHTELLRTVSTTGEEGSTGFQPINFQVNSGSHNITIQFRRTLGGIIEINDLDLLLVQYTSSNNNAIRTQINSVLYPHADTDFKQGFNWTIPQETENLYIFNKQTVQSTTSSRVDYFLQHVDHGHNSTIVSRFLSGASDIGSIGNTWVHFESRGINQNFSLISRTSSGVVTVNTSILDFDLHDSDNNTIGFSHISNSTSNITNNISLIAGSNLLISQNLLLHAGDSIFLTGAITFKSISGSQTPHFVLNSTNTSIVCFTKKERFLSSNNDIGNVYLFARCDSSLVINSSYIFNFYANVPTGETLDILDEAFTIVDTTELDIATFPPNITMNISTSLVDNTINFNNLTLPVSYNFVVGNDNAFDTANCSLIVNTAINQTQVDRNATTEYLFNLSFGSVETNFSIGVNCTNQEISASSGLFSYRIDNIDPIIRSDFINLTSLDQLTLGRFQANFTDGNLFAYNISWFDSFGVEFRNTFVENITTTFEENTEIFVQSDLGVFTYRLQAWDSHNPAFKKVKPIRWYRESNNLFVEDIVINGNIKYQNNMNESITYFYLEENRYKFKVTFNENSFEHILYITAKDWQIVDIPYKQYTTWIINRNTNRYFDFDNDNLDYLEIFKDGSLYTIIIHLIERSDEIEFESIGDLNFEEQVFSYFVIAQAPTVEINTTGITNAIIGIGNDLREGLNMIWVIIFVAIFFAIGFLARQPLYWNFSGIGLLVIAFNFIQQLQTNDTLFNFSIAIMFFSFGLIIMILSIFLFIRNKMAKKEAIDFYNI